MKIKILLAVLISSCYSYSQVWSTGEVTLTSNFKVQFDIDQSSNLVTLTMTGPQNKYLAVAPGVSLGNNMGSFGDDVIVYNNNGLEDRHMAGSLSKPNLDTTENWSLVSADDLPNDSNVRKVIATRAINTGDSKDYIFPTTQTALPILWAHGSGLTFNTHANRGGVVAQLTLSNETPVINSFKLLPNPTTDTFTVEFSNPMEASSISVFNVMGKLIYKSQIKGKMKYVETNLWPQGVYIVKVDSENFVHSKRLIKQ